jgi:hypothetical protein
MAWGAPAEQRDDVQPLLLGEAVRVRDEAQPAAGVVALPTRTTPLLMLPPLGGTPAPDVTIGPSILVLILECRSSVGRSQQVAYGPSGR